MTKPRLEIIGEHRNGSFVFDFAVNGKRFDDYRGTGAGAKIASDLETTAWRTGYFRYINSNARFEPAFPLDKGTMDRVVSAFQRQGYDVVKRGNWEPPAPEAKADHWQPERPTPQARVSAKPRQQVANAPAMAYGL